MDTAFIIFLLLPDTPLFSAGPAKYRLSPMPPPPCSARGPPPLTGRTLGPSLSPVQCCCQLSYGAAAGTVIGNSALNGYLGEGRIPAFQNFSHRIPVLFPGFQRHNAQISCQGLLQVCVLQATDYLEHRPTASITPAASLLLYTKGQWLSGPFDKAPQGWPQGRFKTFAKQNVARAARSKDFILLNLCRFFAVCRSVHPFHTSPSNQQGAAGFPGFILHLSFLCIKIGQPVSRCPCITL